MNRGEDVAFTALVHRQSRFVFRVAYTMLRNSHDAEDAAQETFLKLYLNRGWQQAGNERAFLARVAWRVALDKMDKTGRRPPLSSEAEAEAANELPSHRPSPEMDLLRANQHAMVHAMIDALPEDLRHPLALSAVDELNSSEIGRILGIPEGTVRTRLQRARQVLRQKLTALEETRYVR